jgi:hypothetical protein
MNWTKSNLVIYLAIKTNEMKLITLLLFSLCLPSVFFAQMERPPKGPPPSEKENEAKIEQLKIAFISKELNLTTAEAQLFWPVFNEMEEKLKLIRKESRTIEKEIAEKFDKLTDEEAETMMKTLFANEERELSIKKEYATKFSAVIGKKRALKLLSLEHEFKRELLDVLRSQGPPPPPPHHRPNGGRP